MFYSSFQTFALFWMLYSFFWVIPSVWILYANISEHSVCSIFIGGWVRRITGVENVKVFIREKVWLENSLSHSEEGWQGRGQVGVDKQAVKCNDPHGGHGCICEGDTARVGVRRVSNEMIEIKLLCFRWLSPFLKFQETATWNTIIWPLPSHGSPRHAPYLLHIRTPGLHVGRCPPQPVSLLRPTPTLLPTFWLAQAIFEPDLFPCKCPNILNPSYSSYLPAYEDGTDRVFRNVGI